MTPLSRDNPESQTHYDGWQCYNAIAKVLDTCYFCSMSGADFFNVVKYRWRSDRKGGEQDLQKAEIYRQKFVDRMNKRHVPDHAKMLIQIFDIKVQEALAMRNE